MLKNPFLTGEKIYLSPLTIDDISQDYVSWLNDIEVCKHNSHATFPNTTAKTLSYIASIEKSMTEIVFTIRWKENNDHVGNVSLQKINWINRSGEIAILIGKKKYWNKGVGSEAYKLLIDYGFNTLNLNRISSGLMISNYGMIKICEKNQMEKEVVMREFLYKNGKYIDAVIYSILLRDFKEKAKK